MYFILISIATLMSFFTVFGKAYWVSPSGKATWNTAIKKNSIIINDTNCTSITEANNNAVAGDTIMMRGGAYSTGIIPKNSGNGVDEMIVYMAYKQEMPVITGSNQWGTFSGIFLNNKHYIKVDGITIKDTDRWMNVRHGSSHCEITNCTFTETDGMNTAGIYIWGQCNGGLEYNCPVSNIWFHHNVVYNRGWVNKNGNDEGSLIYVGSPTAGDSNSNNITIENNVLYYGGHHLLETYTKYNVIRNNIFHNEGFMLPPEGLECPYDPGKNNLYGNRCVQIYDGHNQNGNYNLVENNRFGETGCPPDDNGGNSFKLVSKKNIVRYNYIYNSAGDGIYFKRGAAAYSDSNVVYNNTIYKTGQAPEWRTDFRRGGISIHQNSVGNKIKNNIIYASVGPAIYGIGSGFSWSNSIVEGNWTETDGYPEFSDTSSSDPFNNALPKLTLEFGSLCIDSGVCLTKSVNSGKDSKTLVVEDAMYFQDGTWGSSLATQQADWIAVGAVDYVSQIASIDYGSNTITLVTPLKWQENIEIWLFKESSGRVILKGNSPDIGADESDNFLPSPKDSWCIPDL